MIELPTRVTFFVDDLDVDEESVEEVRHVLGKLSASRTWSAAPPEVWAGQKVDERGDEYLDVEGSLTVDLDRYQMARLDVTALLTVLQLVSVRRHLTFSLEVDDDVYWGSIRNGAIDGPVDVTFRALIESAG